MCRSCRLLIGSMMEQIELALPSGMRREGMSQCDLVIGILKSSMGRYKADQQAPCIGSVKA